MYRVKAYWALVIHPWWMLSPSKMIQWHWVYFGKRGLIDGMLASYDPEVQRALNALRADMREVRREGS